ncbi:lysozyme [Rudaeicoccus suwonensis]|uniref:lysozyme n=1 Tax=Rudaeicoccus suwonensis TaxID=657409 RepID=A0A561E324_9MICO|nr:lysozyme [Rudaeicoccus suwonensis]TWE10018.1 GH25 family lysozyme M1 (1,4-beta-N-acetylmuramidase) [Rudaeicoccus suwonensis]
MRTTTKSAAVGVATLVMSAGVAAHASASTPWQHASTTSPSTTSASRTASTPAATIPAAAPKPNAQGHLQRGQAYAGWSLRGSAKAGATPAPAYSPAGTTLGIDVSAYQGSVNWTSEWNSGVRWAYSKATEGNYYTNPSFAQQYNGSYNAGMIRGAYSFAIPNGASAVAQADYFVAHGGGWSADGKTLPGMLDVEYNPYGASCYGLSQSAMVTWIRSWLAEYKKQTSRDAVIYTTTDWWSTCTGNSTAFNQNNPLWIARYASAPGTLPGGWGYYTMWQYTDSPIDMDYFNGALSRVQALAAG